MVWPACVKSQCGPWAAYVFTHLLGMCARSSTVSPPAPKPARVGPPTKAWLLPWPLPADPGPGLPTGVPRLLGPPWVSPPPAPPSMSMSTIWDRATVAVKPLQMQKDRVALLSQILSNDWQCSPAAVKLLLEVRLESGETKQNTLTSAPWSRAQTAGPAPPCHQLPGCSPTWSPLSDWLVPAGC